MWVALCGILVFSSGQSEPTINGNRAVVCGAGGQQCGTTDIVTFIVVAQETFAEVVCPIIKPVEDEDIKTWGLIFKACLGTKH